MSSYIRDVLNERINIKITPDLVKQLNTLVISYEVYKEHPLVLNSQMIGVNKFVFTSRDRDTFFDVIDVNEGDVTDVVDSIMKMSKSGNSIFGNDDKKFKVRSDEFNLMCTYVVHKLLVSNLPTKIKEHTAVNVLNYMQYRIMASASNYYLKYGVPQDIMQSVIEGMNLKYAVKRAGSWKKVMTERSLDIIQEHNVHKDTLKNYDDDEKIVYVITDTSTRIRSQLKNIVDLFNETKKANDFIRSVSSTTDIDGERVLKERVSGFENISGTIFHKVLRKSPFINEQYIKMVKSSVPTLNIGIIKRMIISLSDEANIQIRNKDTDKIVNKRDGTKLIVGVESLISKIVYLIYDSAIHDKKINIKSKISVYTNTRNLFAVHRSSDTRILNTKASIVDMIRRNRVSTRDATVSSLTIALCLYICLISFESVN